MVLKGAQGAVCLGGEAWRELRGVAEFAGGELGEQEPVVPGTSGLLQLLEACGEAVGAGGGLGRGLGEVAGELGAFADFVERGGVCGD